MASILQRFLSYWIISLLPLILLPHPSSLCELGSPSKQKISEGLNNGTMVLQAYPTRFNSVKIGPWWCRGEGRLALSRPFSYTFFEVTSVGRSNEVKVANCASMVKIVLNTWANKCWQNFTASEGTVLEIHAVFTKPQCGIYMRDLFSMAERVLLLGS